MALAAKKEKSAPGAALSRALLAALPDGVITYSVDGECRSANEAASQLLGFPRERLLMQNLRQVSLWKTSGLLELADEIMKTGRSRRLDTPFASDSDKSRWLEARLTRVGLGGEATLLVVLTDVSERKRAEEALRASEQRHGILFGGANDGVILHDLEGRILKANSAASERLGYSSEALLGMNVMDIRDCQAAALYPEHMDEVRRRGRAVFETIHRRRDGSTVPVEVSSRLIEEAGHEFVLAISRDVTERRQAEEALRRTQFSVDHAADSLIWIDPEGRVLDVNESTCRGLEYSRAELLAMSVFDIDPLFAQAPESWPLHWQDLKTRGSFRLQSQHRTKGGRTFPVEITVNYMEFAGKEYNCAFSRDISDRKCMEEELARSEEYFRALIENSSDLIAVMDSAGIVRFQSPSCLRILGVRPEDIQGKSAFDFIHPDDVATSQRAFAELVQGEWNPSQMVEARFRHKDGSWRTLEVTGKRLVEPTGELLCVLNSRDISERKNAEEALREGEEQLRQAQKMEAVGQLAGGIAHDFNNLLTAIIGNSALALATMAPEDPNRELIADIQEVGERAASLTSQILAFSRRQMLKPEILCLNRVILDLEPLLRRSLGEDVELHFSLAPGLKESEIDPHQIGQVLLNLAVNARDAMPEGGRLLIETANARLDHAYCGAHPGAKPGRYAMLAVSDTGCGMKKETQRHIFEPFFTTKEVGKGTGLGLSTAFGIVKQSDGYISVYSEPGKGSTLKVYLPVAGASAASLVESAKRRDEPRRGCERILVVEDEAHVRELVVRVLSRYGYQVLAAGSAQEAEKVLEETGNHPDLLLTDVVLPGGVNGRQAAETLLDRFPQLRVLFMSGYTRDSVVHDGRLGQGIAFLEKPFTPETLLNKVREVLDAGGTSVRPLAKAGSG